MTGEEEDQDDETEEIAPSADVPLPSLTERPPIVGIGSSAGGIEALIRLFRLMPADCGLAFVVIQHLDPHQKTMLPDILSRATGLRVRSAEQGMAVAANTIHVIPPNVALTIDDRHLHLSQPPLLRGVRSPVDIFLTSLAHDQGELAAGVILSGTGSDGTLGLRAIKEHGGVTLAQAEAEYDGMMRSAVATGVVDFILPLDEIPARLLDYFRHLRLVATRKGPEGAGRETAGHLMQICALLRTRTGHDFKDYKDRTLIRRVQRRMQVLQTDDPAAFIERLRRDPREVDLLFQDMLIGVTNFFRDPAAFGVLERDVLPRLFEGKGADDTVRIWVAGCSTGEEAYSIAMLLREQAPKSQGAPRVQVFASDIDEAALEVARIGRYPATTAGDVSPRRLEQFFVRENGSYRIISDLREICLFSAHNLLRDAPFSRLDLLSCRNLLIYLNQNLQDRILPLFHYALRDGGILFLGPSENVTRHQRLFSVVDKAARIFRRRPVSERRVPEFPLSTPDREPTRHARPQHAGRPDPSLQTLAERCIMERYAPAFVVVNADGELLHASGRTGRFLELPAGAPDTNLFGLARQGLRIELRATLHRAIQSGRVAVQKNLTVGTNGGQLTIDLHVQPLRPEEGEDRLYLIVFRELGAIRPTPDEEPPVAADDVQAGNLRQLEQELQATRERLAITTEELESSNEELKSSNEELTSMNEELQSANEELETSREELQSINEELQTVNAELNSRIDELGRSHSDISNLLESTQIATLFLDRALRIKSFTPAARDVFRLVDSDTRRPISHVRARFQPDAIEEDAARVLRTLVPIERQVRGKDDDRLYVMRILPYRKENLIDGIVITFTDISRMSAAEARIHELAHDLHLRMESLETLLDLVPVGIFIMEDRDGDMVRVNRRGAQLLGEPEDQRGMGPLTARLRLRIDGREIPAEQHPMQIAARTGEASRNIEAELLRQDGSMLAVMFSVTPLFNEAIRPRGAIAAVVDISEHKAAATRQQALLHELQHRVKNILATVVALAMRLRRGAATVDAFSDALLERLRAMGHVHDLLARHDWTGTALRDLVLTALGPYGGAERHAALVDGPPVLLRPEPAATFGMILHELATNAAKYGALQSADGAVVVGWRVAEDAAEPHLTFTWTEQDGPPVTPPQHEGFGLGFVKRAVEYELEGTFEVAFPVQGLRVAVGFPLRRVAATGEDHRTP